MDMNRLACLVAATALVLVSCDRAPATAPTPLGPDASPTAVATASSPGPATSAPSPAPTATATPSPAATATPSPTVTGTPAPTATVVPRAVVEGQPFKLALGERVRLPGGDLLEFTGALEDSRCPPDVQCVWAGQARVAFTVTGAQTTELRILLSPGEGEGVVGSLLVRVSALSPASGANQAADAAVTVTVTRS